MELTKYERARIVGARALQLYFGAPPLVKIVEKDAANYIVIAEEELHKKVIPLSVVRETELE
ncbi:DNA-directed RNA polymerase subunit K [Candidatus Micrarchaeota archaeon]|nr:DNA-directed RNA polymerase subunit K [Candidatus Micrarchaeota archaeon]